MNGCSRLWVNGAGALSGMVVFFLLRIVSSGFSLSWAKAMANQGYG